MFYIYLRCLVWCIKQLICSGCLQSILVPEAIEFSQWEAEGELSNCPITAVIPVWSTLTTLDMSHNSISTIDRSVVRDACHPDSLRFKNITQSKEGKYLSFFLTSIICICSVIRSIDNVGEFRSHAEAFLWFSPLQKVIPKVEFLDLSHNQLSSVENLQV